MNDYRIKPCAAERLERRRLLSVGGPNLVTAGDLDPTFADGGRAVIDVANRSDSVSDLVSLPSGKTLVLGSHFGDPDLEAFSTLIRVNADGTRDADFGSDGVVRLPADAPAAGVEGYSASMLTTPDGQIVVAGTTRGGVATPEGQYDWLLRRFNADGTPDPSFGDGGRVMADFARRDDIPVKVLRQPDGRLIVVGYEQRAFLSRVSQRPHVVLARYTADGRPDPTFGTGGVVLTDLPDYQLERAASAALQADGKIVVAGEAQVIEPNGAPEAPSPGRVLLLRYNPDGALDATFGQGGVVVTKAEGGAKNVRIDDNGAIVTAGDVTRRSASLFAAMRFRADGTADRRFGRGGVAAVDFSKLTGDATANGYATRMAQQPDGRLVLAGPSSSSTAGGLLMARLTPDGKTDRSFGQRGLTLTSLSPQSGTACLAQQADGKLLAATGGADVLVARYEPTTVEPFARLDARGVLRVEGADGPDDIRLAPVAEAPPAFDLKRGAYSQRFAYRSVRSVRIDARGGDDSVAMDVIAVTFPLSVHGGAGNDVIVGGGGDDRLFGDAGDDTLAGAAGHDRLIGGAGADTIYARDGGVDLLSGGNGAGNDRGQIDDALDRLSGIETLLA